MWAGACASCDTEGVDELSKHRGPDGALDGAPPERSASLDPGAVRAYWLDVAAVSEAALVALEGDLSPGERARAERIRFDEDRRPYVAAHGMLRRGLAAAVGARPTELEIRAREDGKPELFGAHRGALSFSLSHTRGAAAWAIGAVEEVGVDVEAVGDGALALELAPRVLGEAERARLETLGTGHFFDLWTLKEAFVKATGEGLRRDLRSVAFEWRDGPVLIAAPGVDPAAWRLRHARFEASARTYSLSFCASRAGELDGTIHRPSRRA